MKKRIMVIKKMRDSHPKWDLKTCKDFVDNSIEILTERGCYFFMDALDSIIQENMEHKSPEHSPLELRISECEKEMRQLQEDKEKLEELLKKALHHLSVDTIVDFFLLK